MGINEEREGGGRDKEISNAFGTRMSMNETDMGLRWTVHCRLGWVGEGGGGGW